MFKLQILLKQLKIYVARRKERISEIRIKKGRRRNRQNETRTCLKIDRREEKETVFIN